MTETKRVVIKKANMTNNCPTCFNQELKLSFYEKHTQNAFFQKTTKEVIHEIKCKKCFSIIYPVDWNPDIERVFDYYNTKKSHGKIHYAVLSFFDCSFLSN